VIVSTPFEKSAATLPRSTLAAKAQKPVQKIEIKSS